jgi:hypothetical protein
MSTFDFSTKKDPDISSTGSNPPTEVRVGQIYGKDEYQLATLGYKQGKPHCRPFVLAAPDACLSRVLAQVRVLRKLGCNIHGKGLPSTCAPDEYSDRDF